MDFFSDGALPMGMLFFGLMVFGFLRRKAGNVVARAQYPALAQKLGLVHRPSPFKAGLGRLDGELQGYVVTVDPDDQRRIFLRFSSTPRVELHSYVHNRRSQEGMRSFRPPPGILSTLFKTSHASEEVERRLAQSTELEKTLAPLKFLRPLKTLSVTPSGVTAVFDYGNPPYIPAEVVEDLLPRLALLARTVEGAEGVEPASGNSAGVGAAPSGRGRSGADDEADPRGAP